MVVDERVCLKVKVKSLAEEARIIRKEEKRAKRYSIRHRLQEHRKSVVRNETRHSHIAYGFLKGKKYCEIENLSHEEPNWEKVRRMVNKYGSHYDYNAFCSGAIDDPCTMKNSKAHLAETLKRFELWVEEAKEYRKITV